MITKICELDDIPEYLISRGIFRSYKKAKRLLISGYGSAVDFKIRQPKNKGYYQFRINKKYRAFGYFEAPGELVVFEVSDHQDF